MLSILSLAALLSLSPTPARADATCIVDRDMRDDFNSKAEDTVRQLILGIKARKGITPVASSIDFELQTGVSGLNTVEYLVLDGHFTTAAGSELRVAFVNTTDETYYNWAHFDPKMTSSGLDHEGNPINGFCNLTPVDGTMLMFTNKLSGAVVDKVALPVFKVKMQN